MLPVRRSDRDEVTPGVGGDLVPDGACRVVRVDIQTRRGDRGAGCEGPPTSTGPAYDELGARLTRHVAVGLEAMASDRPISSHGSWSASATTHGSRGLDIVAAELDGAVAGGDPDPDPQHGAGVVDGDDLRRPGRMGRRAEQPVGPGEQVVTLDPDGVTTPGREAWESESLPVEVVVSRCVRRC